MKRIILSLLTVTALVGAGQTASAQKTGQPKDAPYYYDRGVELYQNEKFNAAQGEFEKALRQLKVDDPGVKMRAKYYMALCAARIGQENAGEMLERFVWEYPNSIYLNDIHFALGVIAEKKQDYTVAYTHFLTVNPFELGYSQTNEYNYRTGHAAYQCGETEKAYSYLQAVTPDRAYAPHATYLMAYMDYSRGDLEAAKRGFEQIAQEQVYEPIVPFYLLQIEFQQGNYTYVIEKGVPLLAKSTDQRAQEIARILSEAYFHQGDYAKALTYIDQFQQLGGTLGREELYLAGYSNYNQLYYSKATAQLEEVAASANDELAQNAALHLADAYLKLGEKKKALAAFALAAKGGFNMAVTEDAMFNYGKLQYEQGGGAFNEAVTTLNKYVEIFPQSARVDQAREFLLSAYFNSRNYKAAYEAITAVKNPDNNIKAAMQKIAYFRALECYQEGDYAGAEAFFRKADANRFNPKYTALTRFWRAETLARQGNYRAAIPFYKEYITLSPRGERENTMAHYGLGYSYFNTKSWNEAAAEFAKFVAAYTEQDNLMSDAYNRQGDVAFALREYDSALGYYDRVIRMRGPGTDYARFQRTVMLGLTGKQPQKIDALLAQISAGEGDYVDDAMFELGRTYVRADRFNDGATVLKNLISRYPESPFYLPALSELGLTYQNLGNQAEALNYYKLVVAKFPNSPQAKDAMLGIRNIYVDRNEVDRYVTYARESGVETNVGAVERDSLSYAAAERVYQDANYAKALPLMDNYLSQYPRGAYRTDALYALGDCSMREGNRAGALAAFEEIAAMPTNRYKILATQQAARLQNEAKNYAAAAEHYKNLSVIATQSSIVLEGLQGRLRALELLGEWSEAAAAADQVLASGAITPELTQEANFAKAKYLQSQQKEEQALKLYRSVTSARTRQAAESRYQITAILFREKRYKEAEKEVFALAEENTPYQYWMGKSFLILGDIYALQGDAFQAKATYQSIVDGYADKTDGVVDQARERLSALK